MSVIFAGPEGPLERSLWTREPFPWYFRLSGGLGRENSRFRGREARWGEDLVMAKGPFGVVPEPTPQDSTPSGHHRLLGSPAHLLGAWEAICIECAFGTHLQAAPCMDMQGLGRGGMQGGRESDKVHVQIQIQVAGP